jgi:predicted ferric reductase
MAENSSQMQEYPDTALSLQSFLFVLLAMGVGAFAAVLILPIWLPNMSTSIFGTEVKAYWYISRGSGFVGLSLIWLSMALGLLVTNKMAKYWPGVPASFAIHEYVSLLGLGFILLHGIILMGDRYINFSLFSVLVPFASSYKPFWVGVGQLGFYGILILSLSFYVRKQIGQKTWRSLHYISFLTYIFAMVHGIASGTDTSLPWAQSYYWYSSGSLLFLLVYRVLASASKKKKPVPAKA